MRGVHIAVNGAATTIIIEVLSATFFSCLAFGTATATLVGQSMGQGNVKLAHDSSTNALIERYRARRRR